MHAAALLPSDPVLLQEEIVRLRRLYKKGTPVKVIGWALGDAPFFPVHWASEDICWLSNRIFARLVIEHYRTLLSRAAYWDSIGYRAVWTAAELEPSTAESWIALGRKGPGEGPRIWFLRSSSERESAKAEVWNIHWGRHVAELTSHVR